MIELNGFVWPRPAIVARSISRSERLVAAIGFELRPSVLREIAVGAAVNHPLSGG